jgi:hypothetical protein
VSSDATDDCGHQGRNLRTRDRIPVYRPLAVVLRRNFMNHATERIPVPAMTPTQKAAQLGRSAVSSHRKTLIAMAEITTWSRMIIKSDATSRTPKECPRLRPGSPFRATDVVTACQPATASSASWRIPWSESCRVGAFPKGNLCLKRQKDRCMDCCVRRDPYFRYTLSSPR